MSRVSCVSVRTSGAAENCSANVKIGAAATKTYNLRDRKPVLGDRTNLKVDREEPAKKPLLDARTEYLKVHKAGAAKEPALTAKRKEKVDSVQPQPNSGENFEEIPMEIDEENDDQEIDNSDVTPEERVFCVTQYSKYIFEHLRRSELKFLLSKNFMIRHRHITSRMRYVLVDWLCDLHNTLELDLDSLHLTVCLMDQYLNHGQEVTKDNLQLIGVTALLVASKFEDLRPPLATDMSEATNNTITSDEILKCERLMLQKLDFDINIPLPITFYRRLSRVCRFSSQHHFMGKYLLEICLVEAELCYRRPSMLAAAAAFLVTRMFGINHVWDARVERSAFYTEFELSAVVLDLARCVLRHTQPSKYRAIRNKYASESNLQVSSFKCIRSEAVFRIAQIL